GGLPVVGGTKFGAEANFLSISGGTLEDGCYASYDRIKITSPTLVVDESLTGADDDGIGAYDNVLFYYAGSAATNYTVILNTGNSYSKNSSIDAQATVKPSQTININAIIQDRFGNPLGDHTLVMTASDGVVTNGTQETNGYGEAFGFVWTAPNSAGSAASIIITDTDPRGGIILTKSIQVEL
ncbi:MAG: hypothetical protein ACE5D6_07370, partial [Candidatus Zixiibacteriota bacterium]